MRFLSDDSVGEHRAYLSNLKLKYSILEKSIPCLKGQSLEKIYSLSLSRAERREAVELYSEIRLHEVFFASFSDRVGIESRYINEVYGSRAAFVHELFCEAKRLTFGFVCYSVSKKGGKIVSSRNYDEIFDSGEPILALDVFEHAYFRDFGFCKARYISEALSFLDLSRVDNCVFG